MGTEKAIFSKALHYDMGKDDKFKYRLPKRDDAPSSDREYFLDKAKTGKPAFDAFVNFLLARKEKTELGDTSRIDAFLRRNIGMGYKDFVNCARPEEIEDNSYGLFERKSIRRSLFRSKSRAYLEALCDLEESGEDIQAVLDDIRTEHVPTLKEHKGKEPTFEAIYSALKKS